MMQDVVRNREFVSALADGQLSGEEFAHTVAWVGAAEEAQQTWGTYHVVGEVLRGGTALGRSHDAAFMQRLKLSLSQEAPRARAADAINLVAACAVSTGATGVNHSNNVSANGSHFRWKLMAGCASLAVVSVIGWQASVAWDAQRGVPQFAQAAGLATHAEVAPPQAMTGYEDASQRMIRDPQLDALLAAHRQFGGTSALQMPAGFLRNATFEGVAR